MESYQHGGIATETGPAYIHAGEKITAPGEVVASSVVHIHNEGQEKLELSRTEEYILGDERIIHVTMKAMQTDINYQRAIARAAR